MLDGLIPEHNGFFFMKMALDLCQRNVSYQVTLSMFCNFAKHHYPWLYNEYTNDNTWYCKITEIIRYDDARKPAMKSMCQSWLWLLRSGFPTSGITSPSPLGNFCLRSQDKTVLLNVWFATESTQWTNSVSLVSLGRAPWLSIKILAIWSQPQGTIETTG